jgi:cytochrome c oxidase assembly protein subunit 15
MVWFAWKRAIPKGYGSRLVAIFLLGGAQGALGWYMVVSGLSVRTDVSHLRLSAHLLLALFLFAVLIWTALDFRRLALADEPPARLTMPAVWTFLTVFIQLMLGAWVAGLNAGQVASDWPTMQGKLYPDGVDWSQGVLHALTYDPFLIHFMHRWWAWVVVVALVVFARRVKPMERKAFIAIHAAFGTQIILGIATVMSGVNIVLAVLHQAVGALVLASTTWGAHAIGRRK